MEMRLGKAIVSPRWAAIRDAQHVLLVTAPSAIPDWITNLTADGFIHSWLQGSAGEKYNTACHLYDAPESEQPFPRFYIVNTQGLFHSIAKTCSRCKGSGQLAYTGFVGNVCTQCRGKGKLKAKPTLGGCAILEYDTIIWDESTSISNPQAQITKVAHELAASPHVLRRMILTGEIAPERTLDIFEQMRWCYGSFMSHTNFYEWRNAHFIQIRYDWEPMPGHLSLIHAALAAHSFRLTRKQAGIENNPPRFQRVEVNLPQKVRDPYDYLEEHFRLPPELLHSEAGSYDPLGQALIEANDSTKYKPVVQTWLRQIAGGYPKHWPVLWSDHKIAALLGLLKQLGNQQVPVLFAFNAEITAVCARMKNLRMSVEPFVGGTKPELRRDILRRFQRGTTQYLLMQYAVMAHGMDLSAANTMVRFSLPWEYKLVSQSKDRLFSPLRENNLTYIDIVAKNTVDEDVLSASLEKRGNSRYFMTRIQQNFSARLRRKVRVA
jgi:hypothetical protein